MGIISASIPNFINGVSQQPFATRLASQAEEQVNGYSSVVEGLTKRPPTKHIRKVLDSLPEKSFLHIINRDPAERYVVIATDGDLKVFHFDGTERTVHFPDGKGYLSSPGCRYGAVTVADHTFFLNKDRVAQMAGDTVAARGNEALIYVRQGNYATRYSVVIDNATRLEFTTSTTDPAEIQSTAIASRIAGLIAGLGGGWAAEAHGSTVHVTIPGAHLIRTEDSLGDTAMTCVTRQVQSFTLLPPKGVPGYQIEVTGSSSTEADNYYLEYTEAGSSGAKGVWKEIAKPGRQFRLDASTMPHLLVRNPDGSFSFKRATWEDCKAGDDRTNPAPSFVGKTISDIFFHRNRLGFTADESIIFSEAAEYYNFWRRSAATLRESDLIDVNVSHVKVSMLRHAVPFNESLLLFSDQTQFIVRGNDALTPASIAVDQTTEYEASLAARPVGAGGYVYFATARGAHSGLREYYVDGDSRVNTAQDATSHAPRYIPGRITKITASTNEDCLVCLSDAAPNRLYVHKYYFTGNEKAQSSWSYWETRPGDTILNVEFIESTLWLVVRRADGVFLERMDIEPGTVDPDMDHVCHLDSRAHEGQVTDYSFDGARTHFRLPYAIPDGARIQVVARGGSSMPAGRILDHTVDGTGLITVYGNVTKFYVGFVYVLSYTFSPLVLRNQATGGGQMASTEGRVEVRRMTINYADTGYFRLEVTPRARPTYTSVFSGRIIGSDRNKLGVPAIETGSFKFPIMCANLNVEIKLINDTPLPCSILNADWEALFTARSTRME